MEINIVTKLIYLFYITSLIAVPVHQTSISLSRGNVRTEKAPNKITKSLVPLNKFKKLIF